MASVRREMVRGLGRFAFAEGWSQLAFFGFIGVLLFAIPRLEPIGRPTLVSAVLIVLYLMTPLDAILTWLPIVGRARASLLKIQSLLPALESAPRCGPGLAGPDEAARVPRIGQPGGRDVRLSRRPRGRGIRPGPRRPDPPPGRDRHPGRRKRLRQDDPGQADLGAVLAGVGPHPPRRPALRDEDREAYRQLVSVVFADGHLFPDLHGLGGDEIEVRAREGLEVLELAGDVSIREGSFSTTDLSQGQRRRLALLAARLEDRPILILDEWAANQDPSFKQFFYNKLLPELKAEGKALLVISHDEWHFDVADRVVRLQDGRLLEESPLEFGNAWA